MQLINIKFIKGFSGKAGTTIWIREGKYLSRDI